MSRLLPRGHGSSLKHLVGIGAIAVLLAGCSQASSGVGSTSTVTPSGAPPAVTTSPTGTPLAAPTPSASPAPSVRVLMSLDCRLPVFWGAFGAETHYAGFLSLSTQTLVRDSSAPVGSIFYDRAYSKWLPTWRDAVSPDGSRYAYAKGDSANLPTNGTLHVVDVATGADHIIYSGSPMYNVIDFAAEGIYVASADPEVPHGLWLMNPSGGQPKLISSTILLPKVGNGAAWGMSFNSADPHPGVGGMMGPQNEILRFDLSTGSATQWLYKPGASFWILGPDYSGNLFLSDRIDLNTTEILEVAADATFRVVYFDGNQQTEHQTPNDLAAVDSYGTWFNGLSVGTELATSVWLAAGGRLQQVATISPVQLSIAGGCIPGAS
jgi:hypothetical protein